MSDACGPSSRFPQVTNWGQTSGATVDTTTGKCQETEQAQEREVAQLRKPKAPRNPKALPTHPNESLRRKVPTSRGVCRTDSKLPALPPKEVAPYEALGAIRDGTLNATIEAGGITVEVVAEYKNGRLQGTKYANCVYDPKTPGSGSKISGSAFTVAVCEGGPQVYGGGDPTKDCSPWLIPEILLPSSLAPPPLRDGMTLPETVAALVKWSGKKSGSGESVEIKDMSLRNLKFSGKPVNLGGATLAIHGGGDANVKVAGGKVTVALSGVDATLKHGNHEVKFHGASLAATTPAKPGTGSTKLKAEGKLSGTLRSVGSGSSANVNLRGNFTGRFEIDPKMGMTAEGTLRNTEKPPVSVDGMRVGNTSVGGGPIVFNGNVRFWYSPERVTVSATGGVSGTVSLPQVPSLLLSGDGDVSVDFPSKPIAGMPLDFWKVVPPYIGANRSGEVSAMAQLGYGAPVALPSGAGYVQVNRGGRLTAQVAYGAGPRAELTCQDAYYTGGFGFGVSCGRTPTKLTLSGDLGSPE